MRCCGAVISSYPMLNILRNHKELSHIKSKYMDITFEADFHREL